MSAKVTICIPSGDMVHAGFMERLASLMYVEGLANRPLRLANPRSCCVAINRNEGVKAALSDGADYILMIDSDMEFPLTTLRRLLAHQKDIVGVAACQRVPPYAPIGRPLGGKEVTVDSGLVEMEGLGTGVMLIKTSVFAKLERPWFQMPVIVDPETKEPAILGEDFWFCDAARRAGFSVWMDADLSREIGHIGQFVFDVNQQWAQPAQEVA